VYKSYISLETRILLNTGEKTFCGCSLGEGGEGLAQSSCPVCRREEGGEPRLSGTAAKKAYFIAKSLGCSIVKEPPYERNLSTPELPPEYSLSRLSLKIGGDGFMDIVFHRRKKRIHILELRVEEDAGRLTHVGRETRMEYSTAGMPSLRIKTAADFEIGEEAEVFLSDLRRRIQYLEIVSGSTVESVIRCNAHVAIVPYPEKPKEFVKLRNLNSFNFVRKAVNAELSRQEDILANGGTVMSESRIWNETRNATEAFQKRKAEGKSKFSPVAGIKPFLPVAELIEALDHFSVELPESRRDRVTGTYGLTRSQAEFVCDEKSRADYFEAAAAAGANPQDATRWLQSMVKEFRRLDLSPMDSHLTPTRFAGVLTLLSERRINTGVAKQTMLEILREGGDPATVVRDRGWELLTDKKVLERIVESVVAQNPDEVRRVREGDSRPIRFLQGKIMKETNGLAEPSMVKDLLRQELSVSLVYVLSMGGAISGHFTEDGSIDPGDERALRELLTGKVGPASVRFEAMPVGHLLSEELTPSDWAAMLTVVAEKLNSGTANGIVIAHGTDTLPYTAPLLYWLFADASAPIVLASSSEPPGASSEARDTMLKAIELASERRAGVYVMHGGSVLSPLNLKFERLGRDGFRNWNMRAAVHSGSSLLMGNLEADKYVIEQLLEDAINSMCVIRVYPGLKSEYLIALMDQGVRNFFLELYDTGTASSRDGPYSLRTALIQGRRRGVRFYCTSQQEGIVDFSGYASSRALWREGALPMGGLTTESAVARFLVSSLIADSDEERDTLMEGDGTSPDAML